MVVGDGFEPSKSATADLQSAPFGRSGTPPLDIGAGEGNRTLTISLVKEDASEAQIQLVAMAIASRYKYLKTDEVMLFFFNFKAGMYERFYSYFDPQVIVGSVKSFCDERDTIITVHERELQQKRNEENAPKRQRYTK